ncbi:MULTISPECIES: hypothetical protein [Pseudomonas]|uniref:hypothetical protein n=1 Tax=Pseudomonas TaxID=286 RepID=UPI001BECAB34|nr:MULTISPECIES: hypothetical protein [Pseudomonas]MBT2341799.1 hypothetical protein [Pseudomonas fluorescens]MCD4530470.1 hypothetical protein [Pseudomonas sp. C3-2018]
MAGHSVESLLAWMHGNSQMRGWDLIMVLEGGKINLGLQQDHITRLSQGTDLGAITGAMDIPDTNITHYLTGFRLGAPALSFEQPSLQTATTSLSLAVVEGIHMMVETVQGQKSVTSLSALDPLNGAQVTLDLALTADVGDVVADLANSEEVLLKLFNTPTEQSEAGTLFKRWFEGLDADRRVYALGTFPDEGNPFMFAQSIDVRTQVRDPQALMPGSEDGAVLLFVRMSDGLAGTFPSDGSDFRYLIPDDDAQQSYSATALFSLALIHRAAFAHALLQLLEGAEFERTLGQGGALAKMVAKRGALPATAGSYRSLDYEFEFEAFSVPAADGALPLTAEFGEDEVFQHWQSTFSLSFRYRPSGGTTWSAHTATFTINLQHEFRLAADESGVSAMEGELFVPYTDTQEVSHVSGLPGTIEGQELEQIKDFVASTVKRAILERFATTLTTAASETFLAGVQIIGSSNAHPTRVALPFDLAMFGQVHTSGASFTIVERQPMVAAGRPLQLTTEPEHAGLRWSVENLSESGSNPGEIDAQTGLYQAPPAHALNGSFNRVLVIAHEPLSGERSATLLSVMANPITANPQIQVCYHGQRVELSASHLDGSVLDWAIKNPVAGESGDVVVSDKPGGDHTYIAGPQVATKTFVLDEVEVSHGSQTQSAYVLVLQSEPGATIKPVDNPDLPEGQIQLQVFVNNQSQNGRWSLPLGGPGSIDAASGLYSDNVSAKERFVLITVSVDGGDFGTFEGYIILPLPLSGFPTVLEALAQ